MSNAFISVLFAAGVAAWVYSKVQRSTGGNTTSSLTVAGVSGAMAFVAFLLILRAIA